MRSSTLCHESERFYTREETARLATAADRSSGQLSNRLQIQNSIIHRHRFLTQASLSCIQPLWRPGPRVLAMAAITNSINNSSERGTSWWMELCAECVRGFWNTRGAVSFFCSRGRGGNSDGATQLQLASADGGREAAGAGGRGFIISHDCFRHIFSQTSHLQKSKILVWVILGAAGCGCPGACSAVSSDWPAAAAVSAAELGQRWPGSDQPPPLVRSSPAGPVPCVPSCQLGSASVLSLFINTPPAPLFTAHYLSVFMFYEWQRRDTAVIMQHHAAPCSTMQ